MEPIAGGWPALDRQQLRQHERSLGDPDDAGPPVCVAALYLQTGQFDACHEYLRNAIERFKSATNAAVAGYVANAGLSLPSSERQIENLSKMAEYAASRTSWNGFTRALAEYRQSHFRDALGLLDEALLEKWDEPEGEIAAYAVLAMAHLQVSESEKARSDLSKGIELAEKKKLEKMGAGDLGNAWLQWILTQALLQEAKSLVSGGTETAAGSK